MRVSAWCVALMLASAACGGSETTPDAGSGPKKGDPIGFTLQAVKDRSFTNFGWTGTIHNVGVADGTPFGVKVNGMCDNGRCDFTGPSDPLGSAGNLSRKRCLNRTSVLCSTDTDCVNAPNSNAPAALKKCVYIYDNPTATGQGAQAESGSPRVGACGFSFINLSQPNNPTIAGSFDQVSGELSLLKFDIILMQNGPLSPNGFRGACMECVNDQAPNDGKKDGTCQAPPQKMVNGVLVRTDKSPDEGLRCDVHRQGDLLGFDGNYSMDCSPTIEPNIGNASQNAQNPFGGSFSSSGYQLLLTNASPNCTDTGFTNEKCFCGICPPKPPIPNPANPTGPPILQAATACTSNADCGGETCGPALPADCDPNPLPLMASNGVAVPNPMFNPSFAPMQCRGMAYISPVVRSDIAATRPDSCLDGCQWNETTGHGTCVSLLTGGMVGCYPSGANAKVVATGRVQKLGDIFIVDTGTARCTRPQAAGTNGTLGLPGLTFQRRSFRVVPQYADD